MDMYPSGSINLLELESNHLNLKIFGDDLDKLAKNRRINMNTPALINYYSKSSYTRLKTIENSGNLVNNNGNYMMPVFFEDGVYDLIIETKDYSKLTFVQNGIKIDKYFKRINNIYLGSLNFRANVGYTNLDIYSGSKKILTLIIEVFPSKMDYKDDYHEMISEINEEIASIAFTILDKTYLQSKLVDKKDQTKTEFINILDGIFDEFISSVDFITKNFKHNIVEEEEVVDINKAKRVSLRTRKYIRTRPYLLVKTEDGPIKLNNNNYLPKNVIEIKKKTTIDIFENRLIKYMVIDIIKRIERLEKVLLEVGNINYKNLIDNKYKLTEKKMLLNRYLEKPFKHIKSISPRDTMSLVFKMAPGYKDAYKKYKILSKGLDLGDDIFKITPKKIYELYEIWAYIKLHKILFELGYKVKRYGIVDYKDNGLYLRLNTNKEASMIYEKGKNSLELWYNKSYYLPTTNQRPDTILFIKNLNSNQNRTYIFDAKYRLKIDKDGKESPLEDDINVMHRYRDAIVSKLDNHMKYKYETLGAYVMFPCSNEEEFKSHKFYKSIDSVNVGAFPMLPGSNCLIKKHLKKILNESDLEAKESRLIFDEFDNYAKFKKQDVMVVNTLDENNLSNFLNNKYYHIPKKHLSNLRLGVEYIAFYQPKSTFKEKSGIYYYGKISKVYEYVPSNYKSFENFTKDNRRYLRFNLEYINSISPIEAYEIGPVTISYTSLYLLYNAENMRELKVRSSLEMQLYRLLKNFAITNNIGLRKLASSSENIEVYILGKNIIEIIDGKLIKLNGSIVNYYDILNLSEMEVLNYK